MFIKYFVVVGGLSLSFMSRASAPAHQEAFVHLSLFLPTRGALSQYCSA